jgi:malonyl-CoA/methylmalonyl-CoA synthetase
MKLIRRALSCRERTAVVDAGGRHSYAELLDASSRVAGGLLTTRSDLGEERVAYLTSASFAYPAVQWGIWRAGGVAVPLCTLHPRPELEYVIEDSRASVLVASPEMVDRLRPIAEARDLPLLTTDRLLSGGEAGRGLAAAPGAGPDVRSDRRALIVYTSGTTSRPKGAVTTHANLTAQIETLVEAWEWSADDRILLVLPLHHVHGIVNVLGCALWSGALCEMHERFDPLLVWQRLASGELSLFMGVPTIYQRLIAAWQAQSETERQRLSDGCHGLRLMVSGSAALPESTLAAFREISGHTLLERYGMTETGMILSNPLHGVRRPGHVGAPLPGVEVRRVAEHGGPPTDDEPAEIQVRGGGVFGEYWARPEATAAAFDDGWFRTGDVAVVEGGSYRLLGRESVDILKSGGFKISALEVEEILRRHPAIAECAVVGLPDAEWGQRVAAVVELTPGGELSLDDLRSWARERLAVYKVPSRLKVVGALPRNALGKVTKPDVADLFSPDRPAAAR